jgi:DHA3 family macrolide efflux protein-like MFS transporter
MSSPGWKVRFFTIWTGQAFSLVGSALVRFAIIWWMTETTRSATALAIASLAALLPTVVLGPLVGALVDRWSRRWVMVVADGAIALFTAVLAFLFWRGIVQPWLIYILLLLRGLGTAFHDPAMTASTSLMVPKEHLTRVAGLNQTRRAITEIAGPMLGALLVSILDLQGILAIDIVTALLAIGPLLFIDVPQPEAPLGRKTATLDKRQSILREMVEGGRYVWNWRGLFIAFSTWSLYQFFGSPATALTPLLVKEHFGAGPTQWGLVSVAYSAGSLVGGILLSTWGGFRRRMVTLLVGLFGFGLVNVVRGLLPANAFWIFVVATFLGGPTFSMVAGPFGAILQSTVPPEVQGRVFALLNSMTWVMGPLGLAALGPLADVIGVQPLYLLRGIALLGMALLWALTPSVRNLEDGPPMQAERQEGRECAESMPP